jgi:hypothetical protein
MESSSHQKREAEDQPGSFSIRFEKSDEKDSGEDVSQNDNHMCHRKESLHRCLFGLWGSFYTSPIGIYYKYGRDLLVSTWDKQKPKSNIERIDGIPLLVMPAAS